MKKFEKLPKDTAFSEAMKVIHAADPETGSDFFKLLGKMREACTNAAQVKEILRIRTDRIARERLLELRPLVRPVRFLLPQRSTRGRFRASIDLFLGSDDLVPAAIRVAGPPTRSKAHPVARRHCAPECRMDRPASHGGRTDAETTMTSEREIRVLLERAINALPEAFRTVLVARLIEGMKYRGDGGAHRHQAGDGEGTSAPGSAHS